MTNTERARSGQEPGPAGFPDGSVLLMGSGEGPEGESLLFRDCVREIRADTLDEVIPALRAMDRELAGGRWVAGFLAYEAGYAFEPELFAPTAAADRASAITTPLVWLGVYDGPITGMGPSVRALSGSAGASDTGGSPGTTPPVRDETGMSLNPVQSPESFQEAVRSIRALIRDGDVYQVNMTTRFHGRARGSTDDLFARLRRRQPANFGAHLRIDGLDVLSFSPELFFRREGNSVVTRPMKGTAPRGNTAQQDAALIDWLRMDPKSRAENLMIVDLIRNDLSIVCRAGSVCVPTLFEVETYPTLHQMTSTVTGELAGDVSNEDLFRALFPSGSVTGAPKKRAMQRILELEPSPRGVYCGAIGYAAPHGTAVFNVAIRTAFVRGGTLVYGTGGGIVWDSDPEEEWREAVLKSRFLTESIPTSGFRLIETMRSEGGKVPMLDAHLERLSDSSSYFGWSLDVRALRTRVQEVAGASGDVARIRVLVDATGAAEITVGSLETPRPEPWRLGLSSVIVEASDPMLYHKTTNRSSYERAMKQAREKGFDEVLLRNQEGAVTEGAITNVFVRLNGIWHTPPKEDGLLAGVGRDRFLAAHPDTREKSLMPEDLLEAEEIRLTNGVIGEVRAVWIDPETRPSST